MAKETAKRITSGSGVDPDKDTSDISDFEDRLDRELNALVPAKYRSSSSSTPVPAHESSSSNALSRRDRASVRHKDDTDSDSDATLEILPDRFTPDGQPLDSRDPRDGKLRSSRRGEFIYHDHHGNGLKQIAGTGQWGVSGTDAQVVDRIVRKVEGVLEGKGSWTGLVMGLLSGRLMEGSEVGVGGGGGREVESTRPKRRSRRRMGMGMAKLGV